MLLNIEPLFSKFQRFFPVYISYVNFNSLPWPEPDLGHHDLNKLESTLRKDLQHKIWLFWRIGFGENF